MTPATPHPADEEGLPVGALRQDIAKIAVRLSGSVALLYASLASCSYK